MSELPFRARAFGQDWAADLPLDHFDEAEGTGSRPGFEVRRIDGLPQRDALAQRARGEIYADGFRFNWSNIVTFDVTAQRHIGYLPLGGWRDAFPDSLFSTVAALSLAGVGLLPMHASAVEVDGRAYLLAGRAGAGKSTLTAELLGNGARLIGDDLSVLTPPAAGRGFEVLRGRPAMRLHAATANLVHAAYRSDVPTDERGKVLVRPHARVPDAAFPLAGIFVLAPGPTDISAGDAMRLFPFHQFRPYWLNKMPRNAQRRAWLIDLASRVPFRRLPPADGFDAKARALRVETALRAMAG